MKPRKFYLGKNGKIKGPLSPTEFESLKASGQLEAYHYVWDTTQPGWRPLDPPPPTPEEPLFSDEHKPAWAKTSVICHNQDAILSGRLENITQKGCDFITHDRSDSPRLGLSSSLVLNLVNPDKNSGMDIAASLESVSHDGGAWIYHLSWNALPTL